MKRQSVGLLQAIRVGFLGWAGSDVKQSVCFDAEMLGWRLVAYNRVFPWLCGTKLLIAHIPALEQKSKKAEDYRSVQTRSAVDSAG
jgi:hypothetical protein